MSEQKLKIGITQGDTNGIGWEIILKALADPTRRRILELLRAGDMTAGELAEHFDISKPSLSHHLATLRNAGLVTDERHGQNIVYSLNTTVMQDLVGWFMGFADDPEDRQ